MRGTAWSERAAQRCDGFESRALVSVAGTPAPPSCQSVTVNLAAILSLAQPPPRKLVLIALCSCADSYGRAPVSLARLARLTGYSEPTVANAVQWLHGNEFILKNPLREPGTLACYAISGRFLTVPLASECRDSLHSSDVIPIP